MTDTVSDRSRKIWFRLTQVGAGLGLFVLFVMDGLLTIQSGTRGEVMLVVLATAWIAAFGWFIAHRLGPHLLAVDAILLGAWSMLISLGVASMSTEATTLGLAEGAAMLGLLLVVVRRAHPWLVVPGAGALTIAVALLPFRIGEQEISYILSLLFGLIAVSVAAVGAYLRSLDTGRQRQVELVRVEQRAELARDLHDFVAHHVTGIVVQAQGAKIIAAQDPERAAAALEQIERAGAEAMASMRRMVGVLRGVDGQPDAPVAPLAGVADLVPLVEGFSATGPMTARLHVEGVVDGLAVEVTTSAYRVVMEALTNVRRHAAEASHVDVVLHRTPEWLLVRIADDGVPPDGRTHRGAPGFGLIGLRERVEALGGRIQAGPGPAGGWVVDAAIPLAVRPVRS